MDINTVIRLTEASWQEVSSFWKDEMYHKYALVQTQLDDILQKINSACKQLEDETDKVKNIFYNLENL